jgi:trk system potassium uptake protein TrkH
MNYKLIIKMISYLLIITSLFMFIPLGIAFYNGDNESLYAIGISIIIAVIFFIFAWIFTRKNKNTSLSTRDGFLFVTLSWAIVSLLGALPYYLSGAIPSFADAYFETMSGFSTTGASILTDIEILPRSLLFWRSLTHWLGGMGIVVLTVAVLPLLGIGGMQLIKAEAPGPTVDKITPRIAETAKLLWLIYLGFTVAETILLQLGGMDLFDSLTHTFGTLATGGFSPKGASVGHYNSAYIDGVITFFMILAGINFGLHFRYLTGKTGVLLSDTEFKAYITIFIGATLMIAVDLYGSYYSSFIESLRFSSFQVASILTTTGYATADFEQWPYFSQVVLFVMMFIGGCSGSTGGGIKVIRIATLLKQGLNEMKYLLHPRGVFTLRISGYPIKKDVVYAISGFFFLYIFMLLITTLVVATSEENIITCFTTALATVGNIGPGFGKIGPAENYAFFPDYIKIYLSFAMLVGRLEIYTVLVLFTRRFWIK